MQIWVKYLFIAAAMLISPASALSEILIGTASPQTGRYSWFGEQVQRGVSLAIEDINAAGGVLGERVGVHFGDDACNPDQGVALARKFVEIGAVAIIGHGCSGPALAAGPIYEQSGIIAITFSASHPDLTEQGWFNQFRLFGRDDDQARMAAEYIVAKHAGTELAILYDETAYSRNLAWTLRDQLQRRDHAVEFFRGFEVDGLDWLALIDEIANANVEVVYFAGRTTDVGLLARHAGDRELRIQIIGSDPLNSEQFWLVSGAAGEGTVFTSGPDPREWESAKQIVDRLRAAGFEPEGYSLQAYAAVQTWAQAVEKAGLLDPAAVTDAMRSMTFQTILGPIGFDGKGDVTGLETFVWYVWTEGEYRPLANASD